MNEYAIYLEKDMSSKKTYMNNQSILNEGFFDKIAKFLKLRPKLKSTEKKTTSKKIKKDVSNINKAVDKFEAAIKKHLGDDYPDLPRFEPEDFVR